METVGVNSLQRFWKGKRVLITGHTGFKGGWLALWLKHLGCYIAGAALPPNSKPDLYRAIEVGSAVDEDCFLDINDSSVLTDFVKKVDPEIVFHLAAQPLVRASYQDPLNTFATNIMGTANLLEATRHSASVKVIVCITTDKVYLNREWHFPYREEDTLGGHDPYSASKAAAELVVSSFRDSFFRNAGIALATARAGNVIGGGDWSTDRLIPDAVRAWEENRPLVIRRPDSVRPWQHVLEPLAGYMRLAEVLWSNPGLAGAYNFGPDPARAASVREVIELARLSYPGAEVEYGKASDGLHESDWLALETARSRNLLDVRPRWSLNTAIEQTMTWYRAFYAGRESIRDVSLRQIAEYEEVSCEPLQ